MSLVCKHLHADSVLSQGIADTAVSLLNLSANLYKNEPGLIETKMCTHMQVLYNILYQLLSSIALTRIRVGFQASTDNSVSPTLSMPTMRTTRPHCSAFLG
jgi:hypothetical protein